MNKFKVCAFGDWTMRYQLTLDALRNETALPEVLSNNFVNVLDLHYDQNGSGPHVATIEELLKVYELEPIANEYRAKTDGASLVRVLNRMIRSFKTKFEGQGMATNNESTEESKTELKRDRSRSRSRDQQMSTDGKSNSLSIKIFPNLVPLAAQKCSGEFLSLG